MPHNLYGIATEELFIEILDNLEEVREKPLEILKDRLATMSCKAAVKGNNHLSYAEAEQLIAELLTLEDPYHCPHGRRRSFPSRNGNWKRNLRELCR